ncbi:archaeosortase A [Halogeometricum luteum]|uniref:Archaeosortase A n=1 Tax=Halogeometricum luteum TaxID=2950537 RepID=A0ABU2FZ83_9EURY|nr:archaeosortase A [Halogeometricum sp. S3BR5-2]MDS0293389.1 archaeosortase A [Halogeometricum sp. S3BR5-2]
MPGLLSDFLAWASILTFVAGALLYRRNDRAARYVSAAAWGLFALFWLRLVPHFAFEHKSYIEGFLSLAAVPACLYAGYLLYAGRDSLFVLSKAVAAMGVIYLPFETIPALTLFGLTVPAPQAVLIETVAAQTQFFVNALGYHPEMTAGDLGYHNMFVFMEGTHRITVSVVLACTGLGSMAIFGGLIAAVDAPLRRKARALAIAIPIIYALNLARTTFITIAFGEQYMHFFVDEILMLFGSSDPYMVSFFISDRIISQFLAVVALVGITYLVVREVPELLTIIEDVLYMVTGDEYDLREALDLEEAGRGGSGSV